MKIAMFTDSYFPQVSGVATSIKVLVDGLRARGHQVTIFTTTDPDAQVEEEQDIVRIMSVPFLFFTDRRVAIGGMNKALMVARREGFDLVHTHTEFGIGLCGKYVAYMQDIPTVHTYHTMYEKYLHYIANGHLLKPAHVKTITSYFCNQASGVIAPGAGIRETLEGYHLKPHISVIPTGIVLPQKDEAAAQALRQQLGLTPQQTVLLSLSRLSKEKSLDVVIAAFKRVHERLPEAVLVIVGEGPARKELEAQVAALSLQNAVHFVGEVPNDRVSHYYQMATVYVNASQTETQGLTFLEAIANGLPLIARRNDYLQQLVSDPSIGALFEGDAAALAQTICQYVTMCASGETEQYSGREALLHEICQDTFVERVLAFYEKSQQAYQEKQSNTYNPLKKIWQLLPAPEHDDRAK